MSSRVFSTSLYINLSWLKGKKFKKQIYRNTMNHSLSEKFHKPIVSHQMKESLPWLSPMKMWARLFSRLRIDHQRECIEYLIYTRFEFRLSEFMA